MKNLTTILCIALILVSSLLQGCSLNSAENENTDDQALTTEATVHSDQASVPNASKQDTGDGTQAGQIPFFDKEEQEMLERERANNDTVSKPLSAAEKAEADQVRMFLANLCPAMNSATAESLAEYYCRCQRLEGLDKQASVQSARYERDDLTDWEYWVLTSAADIEYWYSGFTVNGIFEIMFINRDGAEGELLFGGYE